ncbi:hypothetical protein BUALT_Bualt15G0078500 [Buddleja alternifolia]|uniref:Transposase MuDR plant domain-containing protein n=1 Tax=Buddleja alternifolia TaxID=168488 RepID=A0AAV6WE23_9LAMI|nr:hypothetical protein BUALT_Bualt15G0078500 [Buddleja alternifolia]
MFPEDVQSRNATEYMDSEDSRSEFDDSSDADYIQEVEGEEGEMADAAEDDRADDEFSDTPSFLLEDIEGSSDDDIFTEKHPSKQTLYKRLRKFMAANKEGNGVPIKRHKSVPNKRGKKPTQPRQEDWYSDAAEDDDLISLDESENENEDRGEQRRRHAYFREGDWNMKGKTLLKGMKFQNFKVYREALRDYCVRMGVDLHFIRNEASRITARCKQSSCRWRIHTSPVQGSSVFQIKSIHSMHTCSKTFDNSLAKTKYIAKRLEKIIRDYPFVRTEHVKNNASRRIGLEVSAQKIARAKNEAIAKIVGEDGKQYEMLWDYCETVRAKNPGSQILLRRKEGRMQAYHPTGWVIFENIVWWAASSGSGERWWTFIIDKQKGMLEAIAELASYAEHRYCVKHMYENFKKKYSSTELKNLFWSAASSANRADFEMNMQRIERVDPKLCGYPCCHACAAISERRCEVDDYVDDCFKKKAYLRVYEHMIHAVPG